MIVKNRYVVTEKVQIYIQQTQQFLDVILETQYTQIF